MVEGTTWGMLADVKNWDSQLKTRVYGFQQKASIFRYVYHYPCQISSVFVFFFFGILFQALIRLAVHFIWFLSVWYNPIIAPQYSQMVNFPNFPTHCHDARNLIKYS